MNSGELLIFAIHQIAIAAEVTVAAGAAKESNPYALSNSPALHFRADSIDPAHGLVAWHSREGNWEKTFHGPGVRMAYAAGLYPDTYLIGSGIN
jgi:hypothetical protein